MAVTKLQRSQPEAISDYKHAYEHEREGQRDQRKQALPSYQQERSVDDALTQLDKDSSELEEEE